MLTLRFRWKVLYQWVCLLRGHDWHEYAVIHAAWNVPGRYCLRCAKSVERRHTWTVVDGRAQADDVVEKTEAWLSVKASR